MPDTINHVGNDIGFYVKSYWPVFLALIGFVVSILVVLKGKIPLLENRMNDAFNKLKKIEDGNYISRDILYDGNNQIKFQSIIMCGETKEECQMHQKLFQNTFCKKLDTMGSELKTIVHQADQKREATRTEITSMNTKLIETMTQMKTILARDRREETAEMVQLVVRQVISQMKDNNIIS